MARYLLVDANHLASRVRHANATLRTSDDRRSGVVHGVLRGLSWARNHLKVDYSRIICFWDGGRAASRLQIFPDYKSGRKQPTNDEELQERKEYYSQIDAAIFGLLYAGIREVKVAGTEADDLLAIYAKFYENQGDEVVIYSGDKDLHQLVSPSVSVFNGDRLLRVPEVLAAWGLPFIHLIPICKALIGDDSDAIPGVSQIGPKRAQLIAPYQHLVLSSSERPKEIPESTWKWIEIARSSQDVILRNLQLMLLPSSFERSYYTYEQAIQVVSQVSGDGMVLSMRRFIEFCRSWELVSVLENLHHW